MRALQWAYSSNHLVASSGNVDVALDGSPISLTSLQLSKVSGGNVTALAVKRSLDGGTTWGAARNVTLPAALSTAGDAVDIDLVDEAITNVRFVLTVSASTTVKIVGRGLR